MKKEKGEPKPAFPQYSPELEQATARITSPLRRRYRYRLLQAELQQRLARHLYLLTPGEHLDARAGRRAHARADGRSSAAAGNRADDGTGDRATANFLRGVDRKSTRLNSSHS